jgi:hypothetical protein
MVGAPRSISNKNILLGFHTWTKGGSMSRLDPVEF